MGMEWRWATGTRGFRAFEIEIDNDGVLTAPHDDGFTGLVWERVDFLVRNVGRNVDEVPRSGFAAEFQVVSPPHPGFAPHDIEDGLVLAVMMRSGLGIGLDNYRAGP